MSHYSPITKVRGHPHNLTVIKSDDDSRLVFGWANVAVRVDGEQIIDWQGDAIDTEDLEKAAYAYVADFGTAGEMHQRGGVGHVIESIVFTKEKAAALGIPADSMVFTKEKQQALGIPDGTLPVGWWIGFKITDDEVWEKIKSGEYSMFSIEGEAIREPIEGSGG